MTREELAPEGKEWIANVHKSRSLDDGLTQWVLSAGWYELEIVPMALTKGGKVLPYRMALYGKRGVMPVEHREEANDEG